MKLPEEIWLEKDTLALRPFGSHDLQRELDMYTEWMADEQLRFETGTDEEMSRSDIAEMQKKWTEDEDKCNFVIWDCKRDAPIGDIGLFYNQRKGPTAVDYNEGEISMMIANKDYRRKGIGALAFKAFAKWANEEMKTCEIVAKIKDSNIPSQFFFERLGFQMESRSSVFEEVTMRYKHTT